VTFVLFVHFRFWQVYKKQAISTLKLYRNSQHPIVVAWQVVINIYVALLTSEHRTYLEQRYLYGIPPRELSLELERKFQIKVTSAQIRQTLSRTGVSAKKALIDEQTVKLMAEAQVTAIARAKIKAPQEHLDAWANSLIEIADKAMNIAKNSTSARELSSAAAALNNAIKLFRMCTNFENTPERQVMAFDHNFANRPMNWVVPLEISKNIADPSPLIELEN
jgi:hypothetical protein